MKKLLLSTLAIGALFAADNSDVSKQIETLKNKINQLEKQVQENKKIAFKAKKMAAPIASNDHMYWSAELRSSFDYIHQEMKSGKVYANNVLSNRVRLKGLAQASGNLKFNLEIQANNMFGMNHPAQYDNSNWTANETPDDTTLRVKEAYFNYFFGDDGEYMFSAGRRPATEGYPANLRADERAKSPIAHLVNLEFDGFSLWFKNEALTKLSDKFEDYGTNIKFCFGRGYQSSNGKFAANGVSYSKDNLPSMDMGGFLLIPYNDGQYSVWWEQIWAWNVQGAVINPATGSYSMEDLGNYMGSNIIFKADGIGDGISDFLDDSKAFISFAYTKTSPDSNKKMLGSSDDKSGSSVWIGGDFPTFSDEGNDRWGINLVHGSKYFRPMTYGEDTLVGSIAAVRGTAYDFYYNHQIVDHLKASIRFTYLDYNNAGSEAFFGDFGNPNQADYIDKAYDIRAYIKYDF